MTENPAEHIEFPEFAMRIAFAGDWHGNARHARRAIHRLDGAVDVILHVGDFTSLYNPEAVLDEIDRAAKQADLIVMFADGNHERFDLLDACPVDEDGVRRLCPRVWHLPRGFRWEWLGVTFLALGGAHSVDRDDLNEGKTWWPQETITLRQALDVIEGGPIDVMLTHDCPAGVPIPVLEEGKAIFPAKELLYAERHRHLLGHVAEAVQPRFLWHGHYHCRYEATLVYDDGTECVVNGLHRDGARVFEDNIQIVELVDLL